MPPLCYDCRHYAVSRLWLSTCRHPKVVGNTANGYVLAVSARDDGGLCGLAGRFFKPWPSKPGRGAMWRRLLGVCR